jgi:hypothetical protein
LGNNVIERCKTKNNQQTESKKRSRVYIGIDAQLWICA